ncbi:MAG: energy-coupling factor ABC transporter ATP-binding protein [Sulfolobales archaeon]|nr:energy-coupling factor ABC transporter ATP-binding protein [Sulfolobales archaeon]MCX8198533.1 energy-coupling factor ABC transporter ATP-binding protein [Sulfolobales archaeon]MDW8169606.1 ABC transporter ATP-binding protein [Desulfurococcaceae archaeon]
MVLELRNVSYVYPNNVVALSNVSTEFNEGEVTCIMGPGGSGKTTLLLVASCILSPASGEVLLNGVPLCSLLPGVRRRIGILFQDPDDMLFNPTVYDELAYALRQLISDEAKVMSIVMDVSNRLGISHLLKRSTFALSGSEKRRVALASILTYDPDILLLDEPTGDLSIKDKLSLLKLLKNMKMLGKTIVIATHDYAFAKNIADQVLILNNGRVVVKGGLEVFTREIFLKYL